MFFGMKVCAGDTRVMQSLVFANLSLGCSGKLCWRFVLLCNWGIRIHRFHQTSSDFSLGPFYPGTAGYLFRFLYSLCNILGEKSIALPTLAHAGFRSPFSGQRFLVCVVL